MQEEEHVQAITDSKVKIKLISLNEENKSAINVSSAGVKEAWRRRGVDILRQKVSGWKYTEGDRSLYSGIEIFFTWGLKIQIATEICRVFTGCCPAFWR